MVFDGSTSDPFDIRSGVKQGCVIAPTLFRDFFAVLLKQDFRVATEASISRPGQTKIRALQPFQTKSKVQMKCDFLFADDAAITAHSAEDLQQLMNRFRKAFQDFGLTISLKKTRVMAQNVDSLPNITILEHELVVVNDFVSLILFLWIPS